MDVFRRYDVDAGNVARVLTWCLADGDAETGLRICTAVSPCWIVWGTFAEGGEWLDSFLALDTSAVPARVRGAATVVRAQLALSSDPAAAETLAARGWSCAGRPAMGSGPRSALNLLSEIALHTGRTDEAAASADQALSIAQAAGDGWNEGYALGTRAAIAARAGQLREAEQLASASVSVMRRIDQQWGVARALLGLGDLARLRGHPGEAHGRYVEALADPAGDRRPAGDRAVPGRPGPGGHGPRRDRAGQAAPDQEHPAQPGHRHAHRGSARP